MAYDTYLFIDVIESIKGITFLREQEMESVRCRFYEGLKGRLVVVECSDEDIEEEQGKAYLIQLGIEYLIPSLFPPRKTPLQEANEIIENSEDENNQASE